MLLPEEVKITLYTVTRVLFEDIVGRDRINHHEFFQIFSKGATWLKYEFSTFPSFLTFL